MACQGGEAGPPCAPRPLSHEPTRDLSNLKRGDDEARRSTLRRAQGCPSKHRRHGPTPAGSGLPRAHHPEWTCDGVHGDRARLPESPSNLLSFRHIRDTVLAILAVCETGEHTMVKIIFDSRLLSLARSDRNRNRHSAHHHAPKLPSSLWYEAGTLWLLDPRNPKAESRSPSTISRPSGIAPTMTRSRPA